jgi:hypothetical protein
MTEDEVRRRAEANGLRLEDRFIPSMVTAMERAQTAMAGIDPARLREIEPAVIFRAKR